MNIDMHVLGYEFVEHAIDWADAALDVCGNRVDDLSVADGEPLRRNRFGMTVDLGFGCEALVVRAQNTSTPLAAAYDRRAGAETNSMSASGVMCMASLSSCRDVFAIQYVTESPARSASTRHDA